MPNPRGRKISQAISRFVWEQEKVILALLAIVIVVSGAVWYRQFATTDQPTQGGTYVEGIVGEKKDIQAISNRLTKTGLFSLDQDGNLTNRLVDSWQSNAEKTEYTFKITNGINKDEIVNDINNQGQSLSLATAKLAENQELVIDLPEANPNLPLLLTQPLFEYGPYRISKANDQMAVFTRSTREQAVRPYLNKIIIHLFPNRQELAAAIEANRLDGADLNGLDNLPDQLVVQSINYHRYYTIVFNTNKSPFRDSSLRNALISENPVSDRTEFVLTTLDQEPYRSLAEEKVKRWQELGARVRLEYKAAEEITNKVAPSRDFQALLSGLDYGLEADPYYFWHSSQIRPPGNNLTGIKNSTIDTLVEDIRNTLNIKHREELIDSLHAELNRQGVALVLKQESGLFLTDKNINYRSPLLARNSFDRFQFISDWFVK